MNTPRPHASVTTAKMFGSVLAHDSAIPSRPRGDALLVGGDDVLHLLGRLQRAEDALEGSAVEPQQGGVGDGGDGGGALVRGKQRLAGMMESGSSSSLGRDEARRRGQGKLPSQAAALWVGGSGLGPRRHQAGRRGGVCGEGGGPFALAAARARRRSRSALAFLRPPPCYAWPCT